MLLTRDQILTAEDLKTEIVPVPEWGGDVRVASMPGLDFEQLTDQYAGDARKEKGTDGKPGGPLKTSFAAALAAFTIVDESGKRIFTEADIVVLGTKSQAALDRVVVVASRLNRLSKEDREKLEKNSGATPTDDSGSN